MARGRSLAVILVCSLVIDALSIPTHIVRRRRAVADNELGSMETKTGTSNEIFETAASDPPAATTSPDSAVSSTSVQTAKPYEISDNDDDDDDFFNDPVPNYPSNGGGSSIMSLLNLAGAFFPSSSSGSSSQGDHQQASPLWTLKMDVLRAFLQFGTSVLAMASSSSSTSSTT